MAQRPHYRPPDWFTQHVANRVVMALTRAGVSVAGSHVLRVRGRSSGRWRETPVNVLTLDGRRYLVAPRGETQWVRNLRAAGEAELRVGRRVTRVDAREVPVPERAPVLRAYLRRWKWEVGAFFEGVRPDSTDAALVEEGRRHPVFEVVASG